MDDRPLILLTNDDGIRATGLNALRKAVSLAARTVVVAPVEQHSACSHAVTLQRPLRFTRHDADLYSVDGTPADCVYLALFEERFLPRPPDMVLSGINHGVNLGTDVFYSGTVAGAREAAFRGIPAIAFSCDVEEGLTDFAPLAEMARRLAVRLLEAPRPDDSTCLFNVNFPRGRPQGVRVTHLARRVYQDRVVARLDPYGREYFWLGGRPLDGERGKGSDVEAVKNGFISITPLALEAVNLGHRDAAERLAEDFETGLAAREADA